MARTNRTKNGRRKGSGVVGKKNGKPRDAGECRAWVSGDMKITGVSITVHDKVFATFASLEELDGYLQAGGSERVAAAVAAGAGAHIVPDGGPRN